ncbi:hypothetical protein [Pseudarthrobacter sp.]|uniref:hypothetical protein n=1 Tax=Pseudarthrobacter sp. TaxID=1934409 RepID=UPI002FC68A70
MATFEALSRELLSSVRTIHRVDPEALELARTAYAQIVLGEDPLAGVKDQRRHRPRDAFRRSPTTAVLADGTELEADLICIRYRLRLHER